MCGNELSSVTQPEGGWRTQISSQVASGKIKFCNYYYYIANYRVSRADALSLRGLNTHNVKEIELTKC